MPNIYIFIEGDKDEEDWQLEGHMVGDCGSKGVSKLSGLFPILPAQEGCSLLYL